MSTTNRILAGPPGDCCFTSFDHAGTPVGETITIADVPTYLSEPPPQTTSFFGARRVVLFLADVYGPFYKNNMLVQDLLAKQGFTVLGLDYFLGDPVYLHLSEPDFDRPGWVKAKQKTADELYPKWWTEVKAKYGTEANYCVVGYCFGAPYMMHFAKFNEVVATALAHPAFLNEDEFHTITKPILLSCAETDHTFPLDARRSAEDILIKHKRQYHIQVFSGVKHGFAGRGDPENNDYRWGKEQSAHTIALWFHRFLDEKAKAA